MDRKQAQLLNFLRMHVKDMNRVGAGLKCISLVEKYSDYASGFVHAALVFNVIDVKEFDKLCVFLARILAKHQAICHASQFGYLNSLVAPRQTTANHPQELYYCTRCKMPLSTIVNGSLICQSCVAYMKQNHPQECNAQGGA